MGSLDLRANIMIRQIVEVVTDYEKVLYCTIILFIYVAYTLCIQYDILITSYVRVQTYTPTHTHTLYNLYMHTLLIITPVHLIYSITDSLTSYTHQTNHHSYTLYTPHIHLIQYNRLLVHLKDYHNERVIIFAETKKGVDQLTRSLRGQNFPAQGAYMCIFIYA